MRKRPGVTDIKDMLNFMPSACQSETLNGIICRLRYATAPLPQGNSSKDIREGLLGSNLYSVSKCRIQDNN